VSPQAIACAERVVGNNRHLIEDYLKDRKRAGGNA
jgi:hypothetical protein